MSFLNVKDLFWFFWLVFKHTLLRIKSLINDFKKKVLIGLRSLYFFNTSDSLCFIKIQLQSNVSLSNNDCLISSGMTIGLKLLFTHINVVRASATVVLFFSIFWKNCIAEYFIRSTTVSILMVSWQRAGD